MLAASTTRVLESASSVGNRSLQTPQVALLSDRTLLADLFSTAFCVVGTCSAKASGLPNGFLHNATVVLIDALIDVDEPNAVALCLHAARHGIPIVVVGPCEGALAMGAWLERGAHAIVNDNQELDLLRRTVQLVSAGQQVLGVSVRESILSELRAHRSRTQERFSAFTTLTKREEDVLRRLALGMSPEDVARASYVSLNTIRTQIRGILAKLDVSSVVAAVALAYRTGWLPADLSSEN